ELGLADGEPCLQQKLAGAAMRLGRLGREQAQSGFVLHLDFDLEAGSLGQSLEAGERLDGDARRLLAGAAVQLDAEQGALAGLGGIGDLLGDHIVEHRRLELAGGVGEGRHHVAAALGGGPEARVLDQAGHGRRHAAAVRQRSAISSKAPPPARLSSWRRLSRRGSIRAAKSSRLAKRPLSWRSSTSCAIAFSPTPFRAPKAYLTAKPCSCEGRSVVSEATAV